MTDDPQVEIGAIVDWLEALPNDFEDKSRAMKYAAALERIAALRPSGPAVPETSGEPKSFSAFRNKFSSENGEIEGLRYLENLLTICFERDSPVTKPLKGDLIGMLTQVDNMLCFYRERSALTAPTPGVREAYEACAKIAGEAEQSFFVTDRAPADLQDAFNKGHAKGKVDAAAAILARLSSLPAAQAGESAERSGLCPGDGMPCYVGKEPDDQHHRCGTVQCGRK